MDNRRNKKEKGGENNMKVNVNLDDVKELQPVPAGNYVCKVIAGEVKEGPKGKYIAWTLEICEGEFAGQQLWHNTSLVPNAQFGLKRFLQACRFEWGKSSFNTEDVFGSEVIVKVVVKDYEGAPKNKVKGFIPIS